MRRISNLFWLGLIGTILLTSVLLRLCVGGGGGNIAVISQNGAELGRIDLGKVSEPYTIDIGGKVKNTVRVEPGRVRVIDATCPDKICVDTGWISDGGRPIVCMPNGLVIEIVSSGGVDAVSQ